MDLNPTPEEEQYRAQVRTWLEANLPKRPRGKPGGGESGLDRARAWQRKVFEAGYLALGWPQEYGGQALDPMRQVIVSEEMNRAGAPILPGNAGITMVGPTLITWGTEQQKRHYLPKILSGEHIWCQGYSEPNAGSDLAALRTSAEIRGDEFVVNGQKIWTSIRAFRRYDVRAGPHRSHQAQASRHLLRANRYALPPESPCARWCR